MKFTEALDQYKKFSEKFCENDNNFLRREATVESLKDWSELETIDSIKTWFQCEQQNCPLLIEEISLLDCKDWYFDRNKGKFLHDSKDFFYIHGIRVKNTFSREVKSGWDQPILTQVGFRGGILGLIRMKINKIPYYLVEAKAEPGNPDKVQISPTLQATYSNINQSHGGSKPKFYEYFKDTDSINKKILFEQWMSEDGGRMYLKTNKGIIIEINEDNSLLNLPASFKWLTLYQIKHFIKINSWVGPHIRSIISHL